MVKRISTSNHRAGATYTNEYMSLRTSISVRVNRKCFAGHCYTQRIYYHLQLVLLTITKQYTNYALFSNYRLLHLLHEGDWPADKQHQLQERLPTQTFCHLALLVLCRTGGSTGTLPPPTCTDDIALQYTVYYLSSFALDYYYYYIRCLKQYLVAEKTLQKREIQETIQHG